jgi:hypothetical protein
LRIAANGGIIEIRFNWTWRYYVGADGCVVDRPNLLFESAFGYSAFQIGNVLYPVVLNNL